MILLDALIIIGVIIGFILGFKDGFVRKLIGLIGFAIAVIAAVLFSRNLGLFIENMFGIEYYLSELIAGVLIFFGILAIFMFLKRVIHPFDKVNNLINQIVGGIVGSAQIIFFLSAIFIIVNVFNLPEKPTRDQSIFYYSTYRVIPMTIEFISNYAPQPRKFIEEYINEKDLIDE